MSFDSREEGVGRDNPLQYLDSSTHCSIENVHFAILLVDIQASGLTIILVSSFLYYLHSVSEGIFIRRMSVGEGGRE